MLARISTAILAGVIFAMAIFLPVPGLFMTTVAILLVFAAREWAQLCQFSSAVRLIYMIVLFLAYTLLIWVGRWSTDLLLSLVLVAFLMWIFSIPLLLFFSRIQILFSNRIVLGLIGAIFILSTAAGLVWLRSLDQGMWRVLLLVGLVAIADTFAFIVGKKFGKHKLAASISPAKTKEGALGGLMANSVLAGALVLTFDFSNFSNLMLFVLIVGSSMLSIVGDLVESAIKRSRGVKDSGDLLPGHGGILDRIDGLLAATPFFVLATLLFSPLS